MATAPTGHVRVRMELWLAPDGRVDGSIEDGSKQIRPFSGLLALLAVLEDLLDEHTRT